MSKVKFTIALVVLFLFSYLVFLITIAPADKIIGQVKLPKGVILEDIQGTIWDGSAKSLHVDNFTVHKIHWSLNILSLLTLDPTVDIDLGDSRQSGPKGQLTLSNLGKELQVTNADINIDAGELIEYFPLPIDMQAGGMVNLNLVNFALGAPICKAAEGLITWNNAGIEAMEESIEIGAISGVISCEAGALGVTIDPENNLGLEFTAYVANKGRFSGQGYLRPSASFPENLRPVLGFIGKPDQQGRYKLKI